MDVRDERGGLKRIEQVSPHLDGGNSDSWVSRQMAKYGKVESLGFAQDASRLRSQSWKRPELGEKTALGDVLDGALQDAQGQSPLGSVVVFTDGRNNSGKPVLEVAKGIGFAGCL